MDNSQNEKLTANRRKFISQLTIGGLATLLPVACGTEQSKVAAPTAPVASAASVDDAWHYQTILEISQLIKSQRISSVALTQHLLDRIETLDGRLNSYITVMKSAALDRAKALDKELESGTYRGPLHGVPIAVKDLCYTKGVATTGGLKRLRNFMPEYDATVVSKLEAAGAIVLGKLNLTEGAMVGYHGDFKIPVNPWGEDLWAGVSSSGSGVATAAGLCFGSLGTDTGGSIRFPSMANGIVGLKPSYGLVSRYGVLPLAESLDHVGPMTRSVADVAIMLQAMAGEDANDPTSLAAPVPDMLKDIDKGVVGLRIGFDREYALNGVDQGLAQAIEEAVALLEGLGAEIVEFKVPDLTEVLEMWPVLCAAEAYEAHGAYYPSQSNDYGAYFREFLELGSGVSQEELAKIRQSREAFRQKFRAMFSSMDAMVSPAAGIPFAIPKGLQYGSLTQWNQAYTEILKTSGITKPQVSFTFPHDFAGTPGLVIPCGFSEQGFPYTMQLSGGFLKEALLCRIGHAYETATDWHLRHPAV